MKPQNTDPEDPQYFSFEEDYSNQNYSFKCDHRLTPRISIESETDSQPSPPSFHRQYLSYQTKCPMYSIDSDTSMGLANQNSNLQICQFREDGGSFSFSDLDPVQEDLEIEENLDLYIDRDVTEAGAY